MSEEISERKNDMNEAELTDVSGGYVPRNDAHDMARALCSPCTYADLSRIKCSVEHRKEMINYIMEHGSIPYTACPYYNR